MPLDQVRIVLREPHRARAEMLAHKVHLEQRMFESLNALVVERTENFEIHFKSVAAQSIVLIRKTLDWATLHESSTIGRGVACAASHRSPSGLRGRAVFDVRLPMATHE